MHITDVQLGTTALRIPRLGMGTAPVAGLYHNIPHDEAIATIRHALDSGIWLFDTAPLYSLGRAEKLVGEALADVPRDQFVISTKVGRILDGGNGESRFDYTRDGILRSFESSLARLQMDRVDILHIHDPDDHIEQALEEAYPTLAELRDQGVISAVGSGMNQWQALQHFAQSADFDCFLLAGRYTLLEQTSLDFLELCRQKQISILLGGVFNSGILATGSIPGARHNYVNAPPEIMEKTSSIESLCREFEVPLNAAALQFANAHPAVSTLVVGAATQVEIDQNLAALEIDIPSEFWLRLREQDLLRENVPLPTT